MYLLLFCIGAILFMGVIAIVVILTMAVVLKVWGKVAEGYLGYMNNIKVNAPKD